MSDDKMRSEFEAEFPLPAQVQWDDCLMKYKPREYCGDRGTLNRCHTLTMMLKAWQAAQRHGGEAVGEKPCDCIELEDGYYQQR